jgi:phospholipid-binding lipoprotein MlaA
MKRFTILLVVLVSLLVCSYGFPVFAQPWQGIKKKVDKSGEKTNEYAEEIERIYDPLKSFNRAMFQFNDKLYFYVLKPVAKGYKAVLPEMVRVSVRKALSNAQMPVRVVNCILQGKLCYTVNELARFTINTTWGIAGLFDPAKSYLHIEKHEEDFGQTLGFYGLKEVFPITWPFLGPSNVRDTIGLVGDFFTDPVIYVEPIIKSGTSTLNVINETSLTLGDYEEFKASAIDPYISLCDAYFQYRKKQIQE